MGIRGKKDPWIRHGNPIYFDLAADTSTEFLQQDYFRLTNEIQDLLKKLQLKRDTIAITIQELQCRGEMNYEGEL